MRLGIQFFSNPVPRKKGDDERYYDRYWREGVAGWRPQAKLSAPLAELLSAVCEGEDVLDYGAGDGLRYSSVVSPIANSYTACDVSAEILKDRAKRGHLVVHPDDLAALGRPFSLILMLEVLEHVIDPLSSLVSAVATLRPGGRLLVSVPNAFSIWNRIRMLVGRMPASGVGPPGVAGRTYEAPHIKFYDIKSLVHLIERAGLKVDTVNTEGLELPYLEKWVRPRSHLWQVRPLLSAFAGNFIVLCNTT